MTTIAPALDATPESISVPPAGPEPGLFQIGPAVTMGSFSAERVLAMAAAAGAEGSQDPVDLALLAEAHGLFEEEGLPGFEVVEFDPAVPSRRLCITHVRALALPGVMPYADRKILRGELRAVMSEAHLGPEHRLLLQKNASFVERRGFRPLAVASARMLDDGSWGPMVVHGFVPVRTARAKGFKADVTGRDKMWVRVPLWPATLRWLHWLDVLAIVILTMTGFFIADPFFRPGPDTIGSGLLMADVRLVHYVVAWGWVTLGAIRLTMLFFSRNRYVRWPALWPLKSKQDVLNMGRTLSAYALIHPEKAPTYIAHNPLQQLTYSAVYGMAIVQALTGFSLYGLHNTQSGLWAWFGWPVELWGAPTVRLIHYLIMLAFWVFLLLHIYLAVRADTIERHGGLSSMVSGGVWLRRGSHPVDDKSL